MTDMTAFERRVADGMVRRAGPVRPVDDLAIFEAVVAAAESPKWKFWSTSMPSVGGSYVRFTGRTHTMFSPVKAMVAGALALALGGLFLVAQPIDQPGGVPGAEQGHAAPVMDADPEAVYFTASGPYTAFDLGTTNEGVSLYSSRDGVYVFDIEASDPRVSGAMSVFFNADVDPASGHGIEWGTLRIENAGGTWEGPFTGMEYEPPEGDFVSASSMMVGNGDYAGYAMYLQVDVTQFGPAHAVHGVIFKGQPPAGEASTDHIMAVVAKQDAIAGYVVVPELVVVSATEVSPDVLTDLGEVKGRRAAVDIPAGTPITPDLLEPPAE